MRKPEFDPMNPKFHASPEEGGVSELPANLSVSWRKMRHLEPLLLGVLGTIMRKFMALGKDNHDPLDHFKERMVLGDCQPALVVSASPLVVAAYSDEMDAVVMLKFKRCKATDRGLKAGDRLLSVTTGSLEEETVPDIVPGPKYMGNWHNFWPTIAEFVSSEENRIDELKAWIPEERWQRTEQLALEYIKQFPGVARSGAPFEAYEPAKVDGAGGEDTPR